MVAPKCERETVEHEAVYEKLFPLEINGGDFYHDGEGYGRAESFDFRPYYRGGDKAIRDEIVSLNLHRRQLDAEAKRDVIAKLLKANPEQSNRTIAKQVKADDKTVAKVRRDLESTAELPQLEKTVGADGKARKQPARKARTPARDATKVQSADDAQFEAALPEWQAALRDAWLRDHPGKTIEDYELAGTCSDTVEGERAYCKWVAEWNAREGAAIHRRLFGEATAAEQTPSLQPSDDPEREQEEDELENMVDLTDDARTIARQLIYMDDQKKLKKIAAFINDHLKHPERTPEERMISLGLLKISGLNGDLSKTAALAQLKEPPPTSSWRVEPTTKDGKRWSNGVRLASKEEAVAYRDHHACYELEEAGYVTADILQGDDLPNCSVTRNRKGGRTTLVFGHGDCVLLPWRCGAEIVNVPIPLG